MAEYALSSEGQTILHEETQVLSSTWQYFDWLHREEIKIYKHGGSHSMNQNEPWVPKSHV